ncbi:hypothetical protein CEG15_15795 [Vibrio anguillarum]|nr:hypothetical protein CEG15_15795 [Vibrio anguillarum]
MFQLGSFCKVELFWRQVKRKVLKFKHNKRFKRDCQRVAVLVQIGICDYGCYFRFSILRCQPLNRALGKVSFYQLNRVGIEW